MKRNLGGETLEMREYDIQEDEGGETRKREEQEIQETEEECEMTTESDTTVMTVVTQIIITREIAEMTGRETKKDSTL